MTDLSHVRLFMGSIFTVAGLSGIWVAAHVDFAKADAHPFWGYWTRPYRIVESSWIGGSRTRYCRILGWFFTILGIWFLLALAFSDSAA